MSTHFSPSFFRGNRERLRSLFIGTAPIVITAHGALQKNADTTYPFSQERNFWYLTGLDEPDLILVIDKEKEYLILPEYADVKVIFDGKTSEEAVSKISGISDIYEEKAGWKKLSTRLKRVKHVATLEPPVPYFDTFGFYSNPSRARLIERLKEVNPSIATLDLRKHFMKMRCIKQPQEIAAIREAVDITVGAFKKISAIEKYEYEYEVDSVLIGHYRKNNAHEAYGSIVAAGVRACTLHYEQNDKKIRKGDLVLIDAGARVNNYAADITRTYCRGEMTKRQRQVVKAVQDALEFGISQLKPGVSFQSCEQEVRNFVGEKLRELGLIKTITNEAVHQYYPHAPHYLGLDVHDTGDYAVPLEPGMVLTLEPGIYIPEEGIGVRIEDDILITAEGCEVLSERLPRSLGS